MHQIENI